MATMTALDALVREQSTENQPYTNEVLANIHNFLEASKANVLSRGAHLIQ
jgi:hypothetical protein